MDTQAWLYLAMDIRHPERTKLGVTAGEQYSRTGRQTANPGMLPLVHIVVPAGQAYSIERYLQRRSDCSHEVHATTGRDSEWFACTPKQFVSGIKHRLANCLDGAYDEDGNCDFSAVAVFPGKEQILSLLGNLLQSEADRYFDALNDVRVEFGFPSLDYEALFGWPRGETWKPRRERR